MSATSPVAHTAPAVQETTPEFAGATRRRSVQRMSLAAHQESLQQAGRVYAHVHCTRNMHTHMHAGGGRTSRAAFRSRAASR